MKKNFYKPYLKFTEDHFQRMPRAFHVGKFSYAITVVLNYQLLRKLKNRHISLSHTMWLGKKIFSHNFEVLDVHVDNLQCFRCILLWKEINLLKVKFSSQDVYELQWQNYWVNSKVDVMYTRITCSLQEQPTLNKLIDSQLRELCLRGGLTECMCNVKKCSLLLYIVPSSLSQGSFIFTNLYQ